ncbi:MFS transporter [Rubellimicrobium arenae]|uniref:MFS transporter n=1 Tax=Rubellimicrobium arenae TaxID=2817372 RepID=UPI001FEDFA22|nr:MFS transporter [Rubellimicrobium arenae]
MTRAVQTTADGTMGALDEPLLLRDADRVKEHQQDDGPTSSDRSDEAGTDLPVVAQAAGPEQKAAPTPAAPAPMPLPRAAAYLLAGIVIAITQGLGSSLISANTQYVGGEIGTTSVETSWLIAAFMVPRASLPLLLIKIRTQFGLRRFAEVGAVAYVLSLLVSFWMHDLTSAIVVQFLAGVAAAPMSTLAFLYLLEPFPPTLKMRVGLSLALTLITLGSPLAQIVSPSLIDIGLPHGFSLLSLGLALVCLALVTRLPLTPQPQAKVISLLDIVSYLLVAVGFGGLTVAFVTGTGYWWLEARWLGILLVVSIMALTMTAAIELNRKAPLLDIRWLTSPAIVHLTGALLVFRVVLSEQTSGAPGLFQQLGLGAAQMRTMYVVIVAATLCGGALCAMIMKPGREGRIHLVALAFVAIGAWADSQATVLTRPQQMYASQAMIAFAAGLFLPPAMLKGMMSALAKGPNYLLSFIIVFLSSQSLGGLLGSAVFRSFVTLREKTHLAVLTDPIRLSDPLVAQRIGQIGAGLTPQIADPGQRNAQAVATLARDLANQAYVMAYNDAFFLIFVIAVGALTILSLHLAFLAVQTGRRTDAPVPA